MGPCDVISGLLLVFLPPTHTHRLPLSHCQPGLLPCCPSLQMERRRGALEPRHHQQVRVPAFHGGATGLASEPGEGLFPKAQEGPSGLTWRAGSVQTNSEAAFLCLDWEGKQGGVGGAEGTGAAAGGRVFKSACNTSSCGTQLARQGCWQRSSIGWGGMGYPLHFCPQTKQCLCVLLHGGGG